MEKKAGHNQYKKVRKEGGARVLALTPFLPKSWKMVKIVEVQPKEHRPSNTILLRIERVV